jgi:preprotein translocase subunit SecY
MLSDIYSLGYNVLFFSLIVIFTYVYTALMINPTSYADYLKRNNAFIPGVKPGEATSDYIDNIMTRITLPGAFFLGLIGILPSIAATFGINQQFALFFGGTTLLIMVGVALDTLQVIESYLLTQKYDGLIRPDSGPLYFWSPGGSASIIELSPEALFCADGEINKWTWDCFQLRTDDGSSTRPLLKSN